MEIGKDTKLTFSIETLVSLGVTIFVIVGMWFTLQADIEEAKLLPEPPVSRTEYDLKDQMVRETIMDTQEDVKEIKDDVKNIENILLKGNKD
tara:strand:+ start:1990 stop:2265 length:276 start_codon:yes stop_codon:yes gene_type:complete